MPANYEPHPYRQSDRLEGNCWTCGFGADHPIHAMDTWWEDWLINGRRRRQEDGTWFLVLVGLICGLAGAIASMAAAALIT